MEPFHRRLTRREFFVASSVLLIGTACSKHSANLAAPGTIDALIHGASKVSLLGTGSDAPPMNPGRNRQGFVIVDQQGKVVVGGLPQVWLAQEVSSRALGPFVAAWHPFSAYNQTHDHSPRSPLPGNYSVELDIPGPGNWTVAVTVKRGSQPLAGKGVIAVTGSPVVAGLGTQAVSTPTPVATTTAKLEEICTRNPVDHMHYISLDQALRNGKPTVVCFSTPLLCMSRLCGPVTDEQILVFEQYGRQANFIHVEEFLPGPDRKPPPATPANQAPAFKRWKLDSEPWVFVIDRSGVIRFRALGPVTATEIAAALQPLL